MASKLSVKYRDLYGAEASFQMDIQDGIPANNLELLAMIQTHRNLSQAQLVSAKLSQDIDISTLTNPAPVATGSYDRVRDQAVLQFRREDGTGVLRTSIPAPVDATFEPAGAFAQQDVDGDGVLVQAFRNAALDEGAVLVAGELLVTPQDGAIDWDKGWRRGQPHS